MKILNNFTTQNFQHYTRNLRFGWKSNVNKSYDQGHWHADIVTGLKAFPFDLTAYAPPDVQELTEKVKATIGDRLLLRAYINGYTYGTDAFAHQDEPEINDCETAILYLNNYWERDWGGETVLYSSGEYDSDITHSILPKPQRLLIFHGKTWHACRPLSRICPVLRSVLVLKMAPVTQQARAIEYLKTIIGSIPHTGGTFFDHLFRTACLLEENKEPKHLVAAGLFHSIYGNEYFHMPNAPKRETIVDIIGKEAEELVFTFNSMPDRTNTIIATQGINPDLIKLEIANLIEQNGRGCNHTTQIEALCKKLAKVLDNF